MLQVDPTLTRLIATRKRSLATTGLVVLLLAAMFIFAGRRFFRPAFPFIAAEIWWLPLLVVLFWLAFLLSSAQEGFLRRVEARRQLAAQNSERFLATEQPEVDVHALELPARFRLRLDGLYITIILLVPALIFWAVWIVYRWLMRSGDQATGAFWLVSGVVVAVLLCIFVALYGLFATEFTQVIEVTEEGLSGRYKGQESSIRWSDARLFACYGVFGDARGHSAFTCELAGSQGVVKWTWYRRKRRYIKLDIAFEEYSRQMRALNAVIAARTGLLLQDLRSGL